MSEYHHRDGDAPWVIEAADALPPEIDPRLVEMVLSWFAQRGKNGLVRRADLEPTDFPKMLPGTFLLDARQDGTHYIRVAGSSYRAIYGREVTGQTMEAVLPHDLRGRPTFNDLRACRERALPIYRAAAIDWREPWAPVRFQRILLPLSLAGERVEQILGCGVLFDAKGRTWD